MWESCTGINCAELRTKRARNTLVYMYVNLWIYIWVWLDFGEKTCSYNTCPSLSLQSSSKREKCVFYTVYILYRSGSPRVSYMYVVCVETETFVCCLNEYLNFVSEPNQQITFREMQKELCRQSSNVPTPLQGQKAIASNRHSCQNDDILSMGVIQLTFNFSWCWLQIV